MSSPAPDRLGAVALCAALSGAGAVVTEVGWAQGLGLVLGHGTVPVALATAVLLAGWAAGSFAALVLLTRVRRPRRTYALLEFTARLVRQLRCSACHDRDGHFAPRTAIAIEEGVSGLAPEPLPSLTWTGEKLRADWMEAFLAGRTASAADEAGAEDA